MRESRVNLGHAACFGTTEFLEHRSNTDIFDQSGIEVGVRFQRGLQHMSEELLGIGVLETALLCARDGRAERRENNDVRGGLLEDLTKASRHRRSHGSYEKIIF
jgi:hypothetical protein